HAKAPSDAPDRQLPSLDERKAALAAKVLESKDARSGQLLRGVAYAFRPAVPAPTFPAPPRNSRRPPSVEERSERESWRFRLRSFLAWLRRQLRLQLSAPIRARWPQVTPSAQGQRTDPPFPSS